MAERAKQQEPRTFVKKVGDQTFSRQVTSPQAAVEANFDGYFEQAPAKSGAASSSGRSSSGGSGNSSS